MARRLVNVDRNTIMLLPPDLKEWMNEDHIVHFIIEAVEGLSDHYFCYNERGSGSEQYPPAMMFTLLIYCYATGRFSSRTIESSTYSDVAVRYICGGEHHPDHDTICHFRNQNRKLFKQAFVQVLELAQATSVLKKLGNVSIDGTKVKANASKHAAVSYKRAGELIEVLALEVEELLKRAEQSDGEQVDEGLNIPKEISRREDRKKALQQARKIIEERHQEKLKAEQQQYQQKKAQWEQKKKTSQRRGRPPKPPSGNPSGKDQFNFSDPESRIMKVAGSSHFEQSYNAQASVDTQSMLIVGTYVSDAPTDKQQLAANVESISPCYEAENVIADSGFHSPDQYEQINQLEKPPRLFVSKKREKHGKKLDELLGAQRELLQEKDPRLSASEQVEKDLSSHEGRQLYRLRKQTVEPVFGIIKQAMGFRGFLLRGLDNVNSEWNLVCISYNLKRLFNLNLARQAQ